MSVSSCHLVGTSGANRRSWDYILRSLTVRVPSRITPRQTGPVRAKFRTGDRTLAPSGTEAHFLTGVTDGTARLWVWMKCMFYGGSMGLFISQAEKCQKTVKQFPVSWADVFNVCLQSKTSNIQLTDRSCHLEAEPQGVFVDWKMTYVYYYIIHCFSVNLQLFTVYSGINLKKY